MIRVSQCDSNRSAHTREGSWSGVARSGLAAVLLSAFALFLSSCSDGPVVEISESRELAEDEKEDLKKQLDMSSRQRFGHASMAEGHEGHDHPEGEPRLVWDTPEGWTEVEPSMMREVSFVIGEDREAECYISRLSGSGGGLVLNVNRWRGQMGLEDATPEEINNLPEMPIFNQSGKRIELDGTFSGMGQAAPKENFRLLGAMLPTPGGALFIKMTGPKALVEAETKNFDAFVASLRIEFGEG